MFLYLTYSWIFLSILIWTHILSKLDFGDLKDSNTFSEKYAKLCWKFTKNVHTALIVGIYLVGVYSFGFYQNFVNVFYYTVAILSAIFLILFVLCKGNYGKIKKIAHQNYTLFKLGFTIVIGMIVSRLQKTEFMNHYAIKAREEKEAFFQKEAERLVAEASVNSQIDPDAPLPTFEKTERRKKKEDLNK